MFNLTRRAALAAFPTAAVAAPMLTPAKTRDIDAEINHHIAQIQLLQMMKYPHIKTWDRMDVNWPDAEGYGSVMLVARRS